ncbi:hypothetical protein BIW11_00805 [Tropilaelaps mercedesae]|uniref:Cuticle protein 16.8-like n=1 Tax=Tropilaelaps mercedesae TaxID=418985 RepID=A0A1V9XP64_9ACAR|nr:hypothetical protein BIW11_00805 [Tropilaelaps mercedesae]
MLEMFAKILLPCTYALIVLTTVKAAPRFPVPTRLSYGHTVPIAKAAAEAAFGYAASVPVANVAATPLAFGVRVVKSPPLDLSASTLIRAAVYNAAYPAAVAARTTVTVATPATLPSQYAPAPVAAPVYAKARIAPAPLTVTPEFTAPVVKLAPVTTTTKVANVASLHAPQAYSFGYHSVDEYGNRQSRQEQSDANNFKKGSYSYTDAYGISRRVDYIADAAGFRATIATNEPGTAPSAPAGALYNAAVHRKAV